MTWMVVDWVDGIAYRRECASYSEALSTFANAPFCGCGERELIAPDGAVVAKEVIAEGY